MMQTKRNATVAMVEEVADTLQEVTSQPQQELFGGDVDSITRVMRDMVSEIDVQVLTSDASERKKVVRKIGRAVATSGSNMLDANQRESWLDLPQATQAEAATRVIESAASATCSGFHSLEFPDS